MGSRAALILAVAAWLAGAGGALAACARTSVALRGEWGRARFTVEIADEPAERSRGLMYREELASSRGMLFLYDAPRHATFWMKNTLIPLDMLFVDAEGVVTRIRANAQPRDTTPIDGGPGVAAALEINAGMAERLGIDVGTEMRHPFFGADAAWPCPDA